MKKQSSSKIQVKTSPIGIKAFKSPQKRLHTNQPNNLLAMQLSSVNLKIEKMQIDFKKQSQLRQTQYNELYDIIFALQKNQNKKLSKCNHKSSETKQKYLNLNGVSNNPESFIFKNEEEFFSKHQNNKKQAFNCNLEINSSNKKPVKKRQKCGHLVIHSPKSSNFIGHNSTISQQTKFTKNYDYLIDQQKQKWEQQVIETNTSTQFSNVFDSPSKALQNKLNLKMSYLEQNLKSQSANIQNIANKLNTYILEQQLLKQHSSSFINFKENKEQKIFQQLSNKIEQNVKESNNNIEIKLKQMNQINLNTLKGLSTELTNKICQKNEFEINYQIKKQSDSLNQQRTDEKYCNYSFQFKQLNKRIFDTEQMLSELMKISMQLTKKVNNTLQIQNRKLSNKQNQLIKFEQDQVFSKDQKYLHKTLMCALPKIEEISSSQNSLISKSENSNLAEESFQSIGQQSRIMLCLKNGILFEQQLKSNKSQLNQSLNIDQSYIQKLNSIHCLSQSDCNSSMLLEGVIESISALQ